MLATLYISKPNVNSHTILENKKYVDVIEKDIANIFGGFTVTRNVEGCWFDSDNNVMHRDAVDRYEVIINVNEFISINRIRESVEQIVKSFRELYGQICLPYSLSENKAYLVYEYSIERMDS